MLKDSIGVLEKPQKLDAVGSLLAWYDVAKRDLPWRFSGKKDVNPYYVWLSEIMLQQTTVKAVKPYYLSFLEAWPTVEKLAEAELNDVLKAWAGLGYYSRARNLHKCAQMVVENYNGKFPDEEKELLKLPGVGAYTAAAITSIAFGKPATVVDGNVERVISRLFAVETPMPKGKSELKALAETLTPDKRPGDYAQAMMDLGATICSPKRPSCLICPIQKLCDANALGIEAQLPKRAPKAERPTRRGIAFIALNEDGKILVRERAPEGLLGGMTEVPSTEWTEQGPIKDELAGLAPIRADWIPVGGTVSHTFTHFRLELEVYRAFVASDASLNLWANPELCRWVVRSEVMKEALPSVMKKVVTHGLKGD